MTSAAQIQAFCAALFGGPDGEGSELLEGLHTAAVWTLPSKATTWRPADKPGAIASAIEDASNAQSQNPELVKAVYITAAIVRDVPEKGRGTAADVVGVTALWADIDVRSDVHDSKPYPPTKRAARELAYSMGLPPSLIVDSGHGLQAWWVLSEPWVADNEDERQEIAALVRGWVDTMRFRAKSAHGWDVDPVKDISRVMRAPGTMNLKDPNDPRPAFIAENTGARYDPSDFEPFLAERKVLEHYSRGGELAQKVLGEAEVNLHEVWGRVQSQDYRDRRYVPGWLEYLLELGGVDNLTQIWEGTRKDLAGDQSAYDAALIRALAHYVSIDMQVEAVMCRRIRSNEKVDKVDPNRRTDYLESTFAFVHGSIRKEKAKAQEESERRSRAARGRLADAEEDEPEPEPTPEEVDLSGEAPRDEFGNFVGELIDHEARKPTREERNQRATEQVRREHTQPAAKRREPVQTTARVRDDDVDKEDVPERDEDLAHYMTALSELLLTDEYLGEGFEIWHLERRDYGEAQRGRVMIKVPRNYDWPSNNRPDMYRPGKLLPTEWYRKMEFERPAGFRRAVQNDTMIPCRPVGKNKDDWMELLDQLVPYWQKDSSGADLATSLRQWLLEYLLNHPATTEETEAHDQARPLLVSEAAAEQPPVIYFPLEEYLRYVATQPGGMNNRQAKGYVAYLDLTKHRHRMSDSNGRSIRPTLYEVNAGQFNRAQWDQITDTIKGHEEGRDNRLRLVKER